MDEIGQSADTKNTCLFEWITHNIRYSRSIKLEDQGWRPVKPSSAHIFVWFLYGSFILNIVSPFELYPYTL